MALLPALHYALLGFPGTSRPRWWMRTPAGQERRRWRTCGAAARGVRVRLALTVSQFLSSFRGGSPRCCTTPSSCVRKHNEHARRKRAEETAAAVNWEGARVARASERLSKSGADSRRDADDRSIDQSSFGRAPATRHPAARGSLNPSRGPRSRSVGRAPRSPSPARNRQARDRGRTDGSRGRRARSRSGIRHGPAPVRKWIRRVPASLFPPSRRCRRARARRSGRWTARRSSLGSRGEPRASTAASTETAAATTRAPARGGSARRRVPDETPAGDGDAASLRSTFGDSDRRLMTQQSTSQKASSSVCETQNRRRTRRRTSLRTRDPKTQEPEATRFSPRSGDARRREERRAAAAAGAARAAEQRPARARSRRQETVEQFGRARARRAARGGAAEQTARAPAGTRVRAPNAPERRRRRRREFRR